MGKISQLYNNNNQKIYPVTLSSAVIDSKGNPISNKLDNLNINGTQYYQVSLNKVNWDSETKTLNISIGASSSFMYDKESTIVYIYPSDDSVLQYKNAGIECTQITNNIFRFKAKVVPTENINLDIFIMKREQSI